MTSSYQNTGELSPEVLHGYDFSQVHLKVQALTHKSYHNENPENSPGHNEVLEFLGDAVLGLSLSHLLIRRFPDVSEGILSQLRASLVNEAVLAELGCQCGIDSELRLGKGEESSGGRQKSRLIASGLEAFLGAMYMDRGYDPVFDFTKKLFFKKLNAIDILNANPFNSDYKTRFQEMAQEKFKQTPSYQMMSEQGPDHDKVFEVGVFLGEQQVAAAHGKSKKEASQNAAQKALEAIDEL